MATLSKHPWTGGEGTYQVTVIFLCFYKDLMVKCAEPSVTSIIDRNHSGNISALAAMDKYR